MSEPYSYEQILEGRLKIARADRESRRILDAEEHPLDPIKCLSLAELYQLPPNDYLIDELLPEQALVEMVGDSESLKSFMAIHIGMTIAGTRKDCFGLKVTKHGPVLYIAAEGTGAFQFRTRAWGREHGVDEQALPFYVIPSPVNFRDPAFQATFKQLVAQYKPVLIIVDTLHRCTPGADENSSRDMGEVVAFAQRIQHDYHATVLFLHHPSKKDPNGRGRGSGAIFNAIDTELNASVEEGTTHLDGTKMVTFEVQKQKDDHKVKFTVENRIVLVHGDLGPLCYASGRSITSCVLRQVEESEIDARRKRLKGEDEERQASDDGTTLEDRILGYVERNPGHSKSAIVKCVGGKAATAYEAMGKLEASGRLRFEIAEKGTSVSVFLGAPDGDVPF